MESLVFQHWRNGLKLKKIAEDLEVSEELALIIFTEVIEKYFKEMGR